MKLDLDYSRINHTELVEICKRAGFLNVHRGNPRESLIELLEGVLSEDSLEPDPISPYRDAMLQMQERWPVVRRQLPCVAEHFACWLCPAGRVVECVVENCDPELLKSRGIELPKDKKRGKSK